MKPTHAGAVMQPSMDKNQVVASDQNGLHTHSGAVLPSRMDRSE